MSENATVETPVETPTILCTRTDDNGKNITIVFEPIKNKKNDTYYFAPRDEDIGKLYAFLGPKIADQLLYSKYRPQCIEYTKLATKDGEFSIPAFTNMVQQAAITRVTISDMEFERDKAVMQITQYTEITDGNKANVQQLMTKIRELNKSITDKQAARAAKKAAKEAEEEDD